MLRTDGLAAVGEIPPELARALCGGSGRPAAWFQVAAGHLLGWPGQRNSTEWLAARAGAARVPSVAGTRRQGSGGRGG